MRIEAVRNFMDGLGRSVCHIQQGEHIGRKYKMDLANLRIQDYQSLAKDGFCAGVCLEWIRRAVLRGKFSLRKVETESAEFNAKKAAEFEAKLARTHNMISVVGRSAGAYSNVQLDQWLEDVRGVSDEAGAYKFEPALVRYAMTKKDKWGHVIAFGENAYLDKHKRRDLAEVLESEIEAAKSMIEVAFQENDVSWHAKAFQSPESARAMDEGRRKGKVKSSTASYADLELVGSRKCTGPLTAKKAIREALSDSRFNVGMGLYFALRTQGGPGHANAIFKYFDSDFNQAMYYFLDPNYGIWKFSGDSLLVAVKTLYDCRFEVEGTRMDLKAVSGDARPFSFARGFERAVSGEGELLPVGKVEPRTLLDPRTLPSNSPAEKQQRKQKSVYADGSDPFVPTEFEYSLWKKRPV
jgi:hypothetical protein